MILSPFLPTVPLRYCSWTLSPLDRILLVIVLTKHVLEGPACGQGPVSPVDRLDTLQKATDARALCSSHASLATSVELMVINTQVPLSPAALPGQGVATTAVNCNGFTDGPRGAHGFRPPSTKYLSLLALSPRPLPARQMGGCFS